FAAVFLTSITICRGVNVGPDGKLCASLSPVTKTLTSQLPTSMINTCILTTHAKTASQLVCLPAGFHNSALFESSGRTDDNCRQLIQDFTKDAAPRPVLSLQASSITVGFKLNPVTASV